MSLEKSFTEEKQPRHLRSISRRRLAGLARRSGSGGAGWGYLFARRVSRAASPPGVQQTSRPPRRGSVGGAGGGEPVKAASGRQPCSSQTSRGKGAGSRAEQPAVLGGVSKSLSAPGASSLGGTEPAPAADTRGRAGTSARQRPPLALTPPRARCPPRERPPGCQWHLGAVFRYILLVGGGCWLGGFLNYFLKKYFFSPLLSFALPGFSPSCCFGVDRSEGLECAGSDRPPSG